MNATEIAKELAKQTKELFMNIELADRYDPDEKLYTRHFIKSDPEDIDVRVEELGLLPETMKELQRYKLWYIGELDTLGATHEFLDRCASSRIGYNTNDRWSKTMQAPADSEEEFYIRGSSMGETLPISPICGFEFPKEFVKGLSTQEVYLLKITHICQATREITHYSNITTMHLTDWKVQLFPILESGINFKEMSDSELLYSARYAATYGDCLFEAIIPNTMLEETKQMQGKTIMRLLEESYADIDRALKLRKERKGHKEQ